MSCLSQYGDSCVLWTGKSIPELGITKGMTYDEVIKNIVEYIIANIGYVDEDTNVKDAIKYLRSGSINSDSISVPSDGTPYVNFVSSVDALELSHVPLRYVLSTAEKGTNLDIDLTYGFAELPKGYSVINSSVLVTGKRVRGSSVLLDSREPVRRVNINNDRFPITLSTDSVIGTPNGEVRLERTIYIDSPKGGEYITYHNVKDTSGSFSPKNLSELLEGIAAQASLNRSRIDNLNSLNLDSASDLGFVSNDMNSVISQLSNQVFDVRERVKGIEDVEPKQNLDKSFEEISKLRSENKELKNELSTLRNEVKSIRTAFLQQNQNIDIDFELDGDPIPPKSIKNVVTTPDDDCYGPDCD